MAGSSPSRASFLRSPLFPIFMIVFVDVLGLGITIPVLPLFAKNDLGASARLITALTSVYFAAGLIAGPILGRLSDRYGRRPVLIASQMGTLVALTLTGSALSIGWIYVARLIDGLTGGNISVAQAYLSDITEDRNRARGLGIINAAFSCGLIFGPAFGSMLAAWFGPRVPFFAAACFSLTTIFMTTFLLPESLPKERRNRGRRISPATPFMEVARIPGEMARSQPLRLLLGISFGINMGFFAFQTIYALWFERMAPADFSEAAVQQAIGMALAGMGLCGVITQAWLVGPAVSRFGERHLVVFGNAARGVAMILLSIVPRLATAIAVVPMLAVGGGMGMPALIAMLTYTAPNNERGRVIGMNQSVSSLGNIAGPLISGFLFDRVGPNAAMGFAGGFTVLSVILGRGIYRLPVTKATTPPPTWQA